MNIHLKYYIISLNLLNVIISMELCSYLRRSLLYACVDILVYVYKMCRGCLYVGTHISMVMMFAYLGVQLEIAVRILIRFLVLYNEK